MLATCTVNQVLFLFKVVVWLIFSSGIIIHMRLVLSSSWARRQMHDINFHGISPPINHIHNKFWAACEITLDNIEKQEKTCFLGTILVTIHYSFSLRQHTFNYSSVCALQIYNYWQYLHVGGNDIPTLR